VQDCNVDACREERVHIIMLLMEQWNVFYAMRLG